MKINEVTLEKRVTYIDEGCSMKGKVIGLDLKTKTATIHTDQDEYEVVNISQLKEIPKTYEQRIESESAEIAGFYDVGMLGTILVVLGSGETVYGRHTVLGEIKVQMNQQQNRITVTPLSTNENKFPENEIFHHMLNNCWDWYLIKQNEEN